MPATIKAIEKLFEQMTDPNIPIYLDVTSLIQLAIWGRDHVAELVNRIRADGLQIVVFDAQLKHAYRRASYQRTRAQLDTFEVIFDQDEWVGDDDVFAAELESIYFHDEDVPLNNLHAKFLVLARHATTTYPLRIITAYPSFQRLVNAEVFMLPDVTDDVDVPANLDLFTDLGIHQQLRNVVSTKFQQRDYIGVVQDSVQELFGYLQALDPNFAGVDGWQLVDQALGFRTVVHPANNNLPLMPAIRLTPFTTQSEQDDQKGYYHFIGGAYSAFRNVSGHNPPSSQVRSLRFADKRTAIKILCFLSLLFEKIDKRVP